MQNELKCDYDFHNSSVTIYDNKPNSEKLTKENIQSK